VAGSRSKSHVATAPICGHDRGPSPTRSLRPVCRQLSYGGSTSSQLRSSRSELGRRCATSIFIVASTLRLSFVLPAFTGASWFARGAKTLSCWHQYLDECPRDRGRNPRCSHSLPYRCGFPHVKIVCQQIRGIPCECFSNPRPVGEPGARWVNS
jgi:hypothetical protein